MRLIDVIVFLTSVASTALAQQPAATPPTRTLHGVVMTANAAPLARVRVAIVGAPASEPPVLTDARGEFALRLNAQSARLTFMKARYAAVTLDVERDATDLRVRLSLGSAISGHVRDQYGEAVRAAPVIARRLGTPDAPDTVTVTTTTNDLGEFRFGGLVAGAYAFYARPPGTSASDEQIVNVSLGTEVGGIDVRVQMRPPRVAALANPRSDSEATSALQGRVVTPGGAPVARAVVQVYRSGVPTDAVQTDARGRYAIDRLAPGEYTVQAFKDGFIPLRPGDSHSAVELLLAGERPPDRIVSLRSRQTADAVDVILARGGAISGTIVDEFGEPMEGVAVDALQLRVLGGRTRALRAASANSQSRYTDDRGRYRLYGLQPGTYVVQAAARDVLAAANGYVPTFFPGTSSIDLATPTRLAAEAVASGIDLTLSPARAYRIHGTLLDPDGRPANASLTLAVSERSGAIQIEPITTRTNADGTFAFNNVAPGDYVVQALTMGPVPGSSSVAVARQFATAFVTVTADDLPPLQLKLSLGATLTGRVIYEGIDAPTPTSVSLVTLPADFDRGPLIGGGSSTGFSLLPDHTFEYRGVFGPSFLKGELRDPRWYVKSITMRGQDLSDIPFDFGSNETFGDVEVVVSAAGAVVAGQVTDERGARVRDFAVALFPTDRDKWTIRSRWIKTGRPSQDGAFRVTGLAPGNYWIVAVDRLEGSDVAGDLQTPAVLDALAVRAARLTLGEGQSQDLTLRLIRR